jgi:hypothetical protein
MKKQGPPFTFRIKPENLRLIEAVMEKEKLHTTGQTINFMLKNYGYVEKWIEGVQRFDGFLDWLRKMKVELEYERK